MDRISQLPECIVHRILSYLHHPRPAQLVRMSVLSKNWFHLTSSFPILVFTRHNLPGASRDFFFNYVDNTTSRFSHQNVPALRFMLATNLRKPAELDIVNRCLELVLERGVRVLQIYITYPSQSPLPKCRLPNTLLSVSLLEELTILGCDLPSSLMVDVVRFKSLIHLTLESVHLDDEAIKHLTSSCPLLQAFAIISCRDFKRFCACGHQHLQTVCIHDTLVEKIDIEAPNLSTLEVDMYDGASHTPLMNLASCKKLTKVTYLGYLLPNSDFLSNFPYVEDLFLFTHYTFLNLNLSSHSLRTLLLSFTGDLDVIEFNTPNLDFFVYPCHPSHTSPTVRHLAHLKACMRCCPDDSIDTLWFHKLRLFFHKKNGFKPLNLYIHTFQKFIKRGRPMSIDLPPYELHHVELHVDTHDDHAAFVDALLQCCRPRSLTLRSSLPLTSFEEQSDLAKFTYAKLLQQEDGGHTVIQIVSPSSSKAQKHFRGLMPLPMASPREGKAISFIKEKVFQEDAG